jgi:hypothetical protein
MANKSLAQNYGFFFVADRLLNGHRTRLSVAAGAHQPPCQLHAARSANFIFVSSIPHPERTSCSESVIERRRLQSTACFLPLLRPSTSMSLTTRRKGLLCGSVHPIIARLDALLQATCGKIPATDIAKDQLAVL